MQTAEVKQAPWRFDHYFMPSVIFLGLVASLIEAARSPDPRMVAQGWIFGACMAIIGVWYMWMYVGQVPADEKRPYAEAVIKAGVGASMFWGIAGMLVGSATISFTTFCCCGVNGPFLQISNTTALMSGLSSAVTFAVVVLAADVVAVGLPWPVRFDGIARR